MSTFSKRQFLDGAMALTFSTVIVKIIGLVYKIPLMRILGAEGMGYFNSAYELYTLFFVISTAGIPVAISIMVSQNIAVGKLKNAERIYKRSLWLLLCIGLVGTFFMCFGAGALAEAIESPGAAMSLVLVSPTVFFISISGAVRGYFQGCRNMLPTAVSQVIESLGKLLLGLAFALAAKGRGCSVAEIAAFAILGLSVGTAVSSLYLCVSKSRARLTLENAVIENGCDKWGDTVKKLFKLAVPVTVSSVLVSLTRIIDMWMLLGRLDPTSDRIEIYGSYSTMSLPIYNLPSSLVAGIALALVPSITSAVKSGQREREKQLISSGIKLCAIISIPAALGLGAYSEQILNLLFDGEDTAISVAAPLLSALGVSVLPSCLVQVTNSVLQANGKILQPIISMFAGLAVKCVSAYLLIGNADVCAMGAPVSTLLCNIVAVALNLLFITRHTGLELGLNKLLFKPTVCAVLALVLSLAPYICAIRGGLSEKIAFMAAVAVCGITYLLSVTLCGALDADELELVKPGKRRKKTVT